MRNRVYVAIARWEQFGFFPEKPKSPVHKRREVKQRGSQQKPEPAVRQLPQGSVFERRSLNFGAEGEKGASVSQRPSVRKSRTEQSSFDAEPSPKPSPVQRKSRVDVPVGVPEAWSAKGSNLKEAKRSSERRTTLEDLIIGCNGNAGAARDGDSTPEEIEEGVQQLESGKVSINLRVSVRQHTRRSKTAPTKSGSGSDNSDGDVASDSEENSVLSGVKAVQAKIARARKSLTMAEIDFDRRKAQMALDGLDEEAGEEQSYQMQHPIV